MKMKKMKKKNNRIKATDNQENRKRIEKESGNN
jgi:hypothetical protein